MEENNLSGFLWFSPDCCNKMKRGSLKEKKKEKKAENNEKWEKCGGRMCVSVCEWE